MRADHGDTHFYGCPCRGTRRLPWGDSECHIPTTPPPQERTYGEYANLVARPRRVCDHFAAGDAAQQRRNGRSSTVRGVMALRREVENAVPGTHQGVRLDDRARQQKHEERDGSRLGSQDGQGRERSSQRHLHDGRRPPGDAAVGVRGDTSRRMDVAKPQGLPRRADSPPSAAASSCSSRISSACTWTRSPRPPGSPGPR